MRVRCALVVASLALVGCGAATGLLVAEPDASATDSATPNAFDVSTMADASPGEPGAADSNAKPLSCPDETTFPRFKRDCSERSQCRFVFHQIDCCGSQIVTSFRRDEIERFEEVEARWRASCPSCDCLPKPTRGDDGSTGAFFGIDCTAGTCQTHMSD